MMSVIIPLRIENATAATFSTPCDDCGTRTDYSEQGRNLLLSLLRVRVALFAYYFHRLSVYSYLLKRCQ